MNEMQMSERIGNIDDRLIEQAEKFGAGNREPAVSAEGRKKRMLRPPAGSSGSSGSDDRQFCAGSFCTQ